MSRKGGDLSISNSCVKTMVVSMLLHFFIMYGRFLLKEHYLCLLGKIHVKAAKLNENQAQIKISEFLFLNSLMKI